MLHYASPVLLYYKGEDSSYLKVNEIREQTKILRIYFNNHYGGKAVVNATQFKEMIGVSLSTDEKRVMENAKAHILGNSVVV
jgi:hypothetical protein